MSEAAYFGALSEALRRASIYQPALVLDRDRLDANIAAVRARLASGLALRLVDKSLPSLPLLERVRAAIPGNRIMTFHLPVAAAVLRHFPDADLLFGKPMPVEAVRAALASGPLAERRGEALGRIVWLIDTDERLAAYAALAIECSMKLRFAFEVDVGLHRGGYADPGGLFRALKVLPPGLQCEGLMGYEAHIGHIPRFLGGPARARAKAVERFARFAARLGEGQRNILNIGGSTTALSYDQAAGANEVSVGSAFVLPSDFDVPSLRDLSPAIFVATPILKVVDVQIPGLDRRSAILQRLGRAPRRGCYLYGGKWMAKPVFPEGLAEDGTFGRSSNQQFMRLPDHSAAKPGDYAFLRPTQSEAVLQQFGPLAVYSRGAIVDRWPVLPQA